MGLLSKLRSRGKEDDIVFRVGESIYTKKDVEDMEGVQQVLRTPNYQSRVLFYQKGCHVCPKWIQAVKQFNMRVLPKDRIAKADIGGLQPITKRIEPNSAPTLIVDGVMIVGATTVEGSIGFLEGFFEDEIIVQSNR